jgi:hypothetical protein
MTETQSPPAYHSVNDATPIGDQVLWKDGVTGGGDSGFWAEDSGLGGVLGCTLSGTVVCNLFRELFPETDTILLD